MLAKKDCNPDATVAITREEFKEFHSIHWGIECYHRAIKQLCGIERFMVRTTEAIQTHFLGAIRAFTQLELMRAEELIENWYELQRNLSLRVARDFILEYLKKKLGGKRTEFRFCQCVSPIYIDPVSIRTFLTQYGERFYSKRAVEKALSTLEELELEIEEKNEVICDTAREFRIAMVTASRSPVFYQLPYFDSVDIDTNAYQQTLAKVSALRDRRSETGSVASVSPDAEDVDIAAVPARLDELRRSPYVGLETGRDVSDKPACPYCKSDKVRSKGDSWLCQNSDHYLLASGTPKSWKKLGSY